MLTQRTSDADNDTSNGLGGVSRGVSAGMKSTAVECDATLCASLAETLLSTVDDKTIEEWQLAVRGNSELSLIHYCLLMAVKTLLAFIIVY